MLNKQDTGNDINHTLYPFYDLWDCVLNLNFLKLSVSSTVC